jgi:hypothetical protein
LGKNAVNPLFCEVVVINSGTLELVALEVTVVSIPVLKSDEASAFQLPILELTPLLLTPCFMKFPSNSKQLVIYLKPVLFFGLFWGTRRARDVLDSLGAPVKKHPLF